jgi:F-type H+-transporting ATPase subunit c
MTDKGLIIMGSMIAVGLLMGLGALGAQVGDALAIGRTIEGTARQPELEGRLRTIMFIAIGLIEGMYFINLAFAALLIFANPFK